MFSTHKRKVFIFLTPLSFYLYHQRGDKVTLDPQLLEFYGTECVHCNEMKPLVAKLEKEIGKELTKLEVWHNQTNLKKLQEADQGRCGGVPFFFNKKTGTFICGSTSYENLKKWATGK